MMLLIGIDIKVDVVIIAEANYDLFNAYPNVHIGIKKNPPTPSCSYVLVLLVFS